MLDRFVAPAPVSFAAKRLPRADLQLVATCALGLERLLAAEISGLGCEATASSKGSVEFGGGWEDVWRCNLRLRTANRVLVRLASWPATDGDELARGAGALVLSDREWQGLSARSRFNPDATLALRAASRRSRMRDTRWIVLRAKDGIVDAQRRFWNRRSSVERKTPDVALRIFLEDDVATLLLDTSGEPLDRRGYRLDRRTAPIRESLAAACVLAGDWDGSGPASAWHPTATGAGGSSRDSAPSTGLRFAASPRRRRPPSPPASGCTASTGIARRS